MRTIYLVGHPEDGVLDKDLQEAGFIVLPAQNADGAVGMLSAVRADAFVIDVGDSVIGGERLIDWLRSSSMWRHVPMIVTGVHSVQRRRIARRAVVRAIIPRAQSTSHAVVAAVWRALEHKPSRPFKIAPTRHGAEKSATYQMPQAAPDRLSSAGAA
jgi:DNA-binding response OmpR family regulator